MEDTKILEKHFKKEMLNKDFESFKKSHPTLLKCILKSMNEISSKNKPIKNN